MQESFHSEEHEGKSALVLLRMRRFRLPAKLPPQAVTPSMAWITVILIATPPSHLDM
jgi:hypothetical protein